MESELLKEHSAKVLLGALQTATIPATHVEPFYRAVLSLQRIAEGKDVVSELPEEAAQ